MNLDAIKARLAKLNERSAGGEDTRKYFWTAPIGKSVIRVVPSAYNPDDVATELQFHNKISKYPTLSLTNLGKQDPVEEFREKLREKGGTDNWSLNGKLTPNSRYMVPIIVRGEEEKGVRIWSVGVSMYKTLIRLAADDEIGDFTDVHEGYDIKVTKVEGDPYPETTIDLARKSTPLSEDSALIEKWLKNQPEPIKCFYEPTYDHVKKLLETYLNGGIAPKSENKKESKAVQTSTGTEQPKEQASTATPTASPAKPLKDPSKEFDDLFGKSSDDIDSLFDDKKPAEEDNDLPF